MGSTFSIRVADAADIPAINRFLSRKAIIHRHLDWRQPIDWVTSGRFLLLHNRRCEIEALLCCAPEVDGYDWLRVFAYCNKGTQFSAWNQLLQMTLQTLYTEQAPNKILSLAYNAWMIELLELEGWREVDRLVQLEWDKSVLVDRPQTETQFVIRNMTEQDLARVHHIDCLSFDVIWQQSFETMSASLHQSGYAAVYEENGQILGFQISTTSKEIAHLARIAVHPDHRKRYIGNLLLQDLLNYSQRHKIRNVSVNTQLSNTRSISLYKKMGFHEKGASFPVFSFE
jgi:ribosomal-protein-alanine N-acetyltransferase